MAGTRDPLPGDTRVGSSSVPAVSWWQPGSQVLPVIVSAAPSVTCIVQGDIFFIQLAFTGRTANTSVFMLFPPLITNDFAVNAYYLLKIRRIVESQTHECIWESTGKDWHRLLLPLRECCFPSQHLPGTSRPLALDGASVYLHLESAKFNKMERERDPWGYVCLLLHSQHLFPHSLTQRCKSEVKFNLNEN